MPKRIECPRCDRADFVREGSPNTYLMTQGFTHFCKECQRNCDVPADCFEAWCFHVGADGKISKAPRPNGLRVEIDDSMKAFGLACHSAGIGKTVEVDVGGDNTHEMTVIAAEAVEIGQMVYLDDDGKARVMTAAEDDDAPLLNQHLFDDVIEAARLKAGGIPTERGHKEKNEAQASRASRAAVWMFKAGAASGAGAAIVWAVKQLLNGALLWAAI